MTQSAASAVFNDAYTKPYPAKRAIAQMTISDSTYSITVSIRKTRLRFMLKLLAILALLSPILFYFYVGLFLGVAVIPDSTNKQTTEFLLPAIKKELLESGAYTKGRDYEWFGSGSVRVPHATIQVYQVDQLPPNSYRKLMHASLDKMLDIQNVASATVEAYAGKNRPGTDPLKGTAMPLVSITVNKTAN